MSKWLFLDGREVLFAVAPRYGRARLALPAGVDVDEAQLRSALSAADEATPIAEDEIHTERDERSYWITYWRAFLRHLKLPESHAAVMHREALWVNHARIYPEVPAMLGRLVDQGVQLGLISNGPPSFTLGLSEMGLLYFFQTVIVSSEVGVRKPDPRIFRLALGTAGADAPRSWFVDDQSAHVRAARALGMRSLLLDRVGGKGEISSLADLPERMA